MTLRDILRDARDRRDAAQDAYARAVSAAYSAGHGYGTIARWLELPRSTVQGMVNRYRGRDEE